MAIDPTRVPRFAHGSRVPGWDDAADLTKDPAVVPDPATTPVPAELRAEIEAHMAKYPDRRSAAIPALHAVQRRYGWCSPEGIEQAACVMRLTPAYLTAVATFYDMLDTRPVGRTTSTSARTSRARCAAPTSCSRPSTSTAATTRTSTSAPSSASAPATSRRWPRSTASYVGPIGPDEVPAVLAAMRHGEEPRTAARPPAEAPARSPKPPSAVP